MRYKMDIAQSSTTRPGLKGKHPQVNDWKGQLHAARTGNGDARSRGGQISIVQ